jgi:hypothetical protein
VPESCGAAFPAIAMAMTSSGDVAPSPDPRQLVVLLARRFQLLGEPMRRWRGLRPPGIHLIFVAAAVARTGL